jgi:hypothetical protein
MKLIAIIAATAIGALALPSLASASPNWHSCPTAPRSMSSFEWSARVSGLEARGKMNCASARYAYATMVGRKLPRTFSDGYVTWHRSVRTLSGPTSGGCGTWTSIVTFKEYGSGTAFRVRLWETGC